MRRVFLALRPSAIVFIACLVSGVEAWGFDLTGTWTGEARCRVYDGIWTKEIVKFGPGNPVKILQSGRVLAIETESGEFGLAYNGEAVQDTKNLDRGRVIMTECRSNTALDGYNEVAHLQGTATPDRGRLRGYSMVRTLFGEVGRCIWLLNRASAETPVITNCPCCP